VVKFLGGLGHSLQDAAGKINLFVEKSRRGFFRTGFRAE